MIAFDPRSAIPGRWSLKPEETLGMVFWTKNPTNLVKEAHLFEGHRLKIHVTLTGWEEVEKGAPSLLEGCDILTRTAKQFGPENVTWRFSPVPLVPDVVDRFTRIAKVAGEAGIQSVYLSFLQTNDRMAEPRSREEKLELLVELADRAKRHNVKVLLCNEDHLLAKISDLPDNLSSGVCQPPEDFGQVGLKIPPSEGCGCVLLADPFTFNESCSLGCQYCYAADKSLSPKKHNTTKGLPVVR